jgi:hypothetical protein
LRHAHQIALSELVRLQAHLNFTQSRHLVRSGLPARRDSRVELVERDRMT